MRNNYGIDPPYYQIKVIFKPDGVKPYNTSERREVEFEVTEEKDREYYYNKAKDIAVRDGIISQYGLQYWEPYDIDINTPTPPSEVNHIQHY